MIIGDHKPIRRNDEARAHGLGVARPLLLTPALPELVAELTEEAFDSFRKSATKVVWILVKCVEFGAVVLDEGRTVKIVGAVLRNHFDLGARVSSILGRIAG